jgi:hypothetical protein
MPLPEQSSLQLGLGLVSPGTDPHRAAERDEERAMFQVIFSLELVMLLVPSDNHQPDRLLSATCILFLIQ